MKTRALRRYLSGLLLLVSLAVGAQPQTASAATPPSARGAVDLEGKPVQPLRDPAARAVVLLFVRTDCPLSNRYAPVLNNLYDRYTRQQVEFWLVYSDPHQKPDEVRDQMRDYGFRARPVIDAQHVLAKLSAVKVTPEVAVFVGQKLVYHGRIDNQYPALGMSRPRPTQNDLDRVLSAVVEHRPAPETATRAVGCALSDLQ
jgi:AhpC/TSA family